MQFKFGGGKFKFGNESFKFGGNEAYFRSKSSIIWFFSAIGSE